MNPHPARPDRLETFLGFDTPLPCLVCGTPTRWGHVWLTGHSTVAFTLEAYCPQHGFPERIDALGVSGTPTPQEYQEQEDSVARFVVAMQGGQGRVAVLAPVHPELAPGFHLWQEEQDGETDEEDDDEEDEEVWHGPQWQLRAWSVSYEAEIGAAPVAFIVVYDEEYTQFHLCAEDGSCRPPQHSRQEATDRQYEH